MVAFSQVLTTTWELSILPVPGKAATREQRIAYFHNQLDRIAAAVSKGDTVDILGGLRLSGCGPRDRLEGGKHTMKVSTECALHVNSYLDVYDLAVELQEQISEESWL
jgi:hypothetical protein